MSHSSISACPGVGSAPRKIIATEHPWISIVMLTVSAEHDDLFAALSAGASGYLMKGQDPAKLPNVLRMVLSGEAALPATLVKQLAEEYRARDEHRGIRARLPGSARLTPREWEVLELLNDGLGTAEISRRLFVADVTVRTHLRGIIRKLNVKDRAGVLRLVRGEPSWPSAQTSTRPPIAIR